MSPMITEEKDRENAWKDYITKGNDFSNWFTAIIISNFVYLNSIELTERTGLWWVGFGIAIPTFICIFLFKSLGVLAARDRVKMNDPGLSGEGKRKEREKLENCQKKTEKLRAKLSISFVVLGVLIVFCSAWILIGRSGLIPVIIQNLNNLIHYEQTR